jgi:hypothetical protein
MKNFFVGKEIVIDAGIRGTVPLKGMLLTNYLLEVYYTKDGVDLLSKNFHMLMYKITTANGFDVVFDFVHAVAKEFQHFGFLQRNSPYFEELFPLLTTEFVDIKALGYIKEGKVAELTIFLYLMVDLISPKNRLKPIKGIEGKGPLFHDKNIHYLDSVVGNLKIQGFSKEEEDHKLDTLLQLQVLMEGGKELHSFYIKNFTTLIKDNEKECISSFTGETKAARFISLQNRQKNIRLIAAKGCLIYCTYQICT